MPNLGTLCVYLISGTFIALLTLPTGIPAAPLAGAILGAGLVSMTGKIELAECVLYLNTHASIFELLLHFE